MESFMRFARMVLPVAAVILMVIAGWFLYIYMRSITPLAEVKKPVTIYHPGALPTLAPKFLDRSKELAVLLARGSEIKPGVYYSGYYIAVDAPPEEANQLYRNNFILNGWRVNDRPASGTSKYIWWFYDIDPGRWGGVRVEELGTGSAVLFDFYADKKAVGRIVK